VTKLEESSELYQKLHKIRKNRVFSQKNSKKTKKIQKNEKKIEKN